MQDQREKGGNEARSLLEKIEKWRVLQMIPVLEHNFLKRRLF